MFARTMFVGALCAVTTVGAHAQQESDQWRWRGEVGDGRTVYLRNLNGAVRVEAGSGNGVEVTAVKRWRRGDPAEVRIEARTLGSGRGDVIVCALWGPEATCDEDGYHSNRDRRGWRDRDGDVSVEFTVRVPAHARVVASTVNGAVRIEGTRNDITASTVNGEVEAMSNGGRVKAGTVNGGITVRTTMPADADLEYTTVNGSITLELPGSANADVNLSTVNGRISSDFPMTLDGEINPRRIRATIGSGGRRLRASTVNGSIRLRRI